MIITKENYFSEEAQMAFFGSSQFKSFLDCEARTMAEIRGEYVPEKSTALLVGSYVDAYFEGSLSDFYREHPEIFRRDGNLKSDYVQAEEIIRRCESDDLYMEYMSGEKQVIMTAELFGHPFKIKIDSYLPGRAIVDQKVLRDFDKVYVDGMGKVNCIEAWGYDIQGAIYQAVELQHRIDQGEENAKPLPFILAAVTKQKEPDIGLFAVPQHKLDAALKIVEANVDYFAAVKRGMDEPLRCGKCAYCRKTKKLHSVTVLEDIENE